MVIPSEEILDQLRKAFQRESDTGALDRSVPEGMEQFVNTISSQENMEKLDRLRGIFKDYKKATIPERRKILARAKG
ncbi:MAG: hypothetical protein J7M18_08490, partial [Candidatus Eremiobacteraeota bacterium]|nr:hypothetical protein [Candidatus Eremiobacteraeota bacterium]